MLLLIYSDDSKMKRRWEMNISFHQIEDNIVITHLLNSINLQEIKNNIKINGSGEKVVLIGDSSIKIKSVVDSLLHEIKNDIHCNNATIYGKVLKEICLITDKHSIYYKETIEKASNVSNFIFNVRNVLGDDLDKGKLLKIGMKIAHQEAERNKMTEETFNKVKDKLEIRYDDEIKNINSAFNEINKFNEDVLKFLPFKDDVIKEMEEKIHSDYNFLLEKLLKTSNRSENMSDDVKKATAHYIKLCKIMEINPKDIFLTKILRFEEKIYKNDINNIIKLLKDDGINSSAQIPSLKDVQRLKIRIEEYLNLCSDIHVDFGDQEKQELPRWQFDLIKKLENLKFLEELILVKSFAFKYEPKIETNLDFIKKFNKKFPAGENASILKQIIANKIHEDHKILIDNLKEFYAENNDPKINEALIDQINDINMYYLDCCYELNENPRDVYLEGVNINVSEIYNIEKILNNRLIKDINKKEQSKLAETVLLTKKYLAALEEARLNENSALVIPTWEIKLRDKLANIEEMYRKSYENGVRKFKEDQILMELYCNDAQDQTKEVFENKEDLIKKMFNHSNNLIEDVILIPITKTNEDEIKKMYGDCEKLCTLSFKLNYERIKNGITTVDSVSKYEKDYFLFLLENELGSWDRQVEKFEKLGFENVDLKEMGKELREGFNVMRK